MRERAEAMHQKINEKLIGSFRGKVEEKNVPIDQNTGRIGQELLENKFDRLEIPITIYTPVDVQKDKMVVFFHGGGGVTIG